MMSSSRLHDTQSCRNIRRCVATLKRRIIIVCILKQIEMSTEKIAEHLEQGRLTLTVMDDGSGVLLDVKDEALFNLNATGLFVIQQIKNDCESLDALAEAVAQKFKIDTPRARQDVETFTNALSATL